jgi:creatine kinase
MQTVTEKDIRQAEEYLVANDIPNLLEGLARQIVIGKPRDPLGYCLQFFQAKQQEVFEGFLKTLEENRRTNPNNLCAKHMTRELFMSYPAEQRDILYRCCKTGADNADSGVGCYILTPDNLKMYRKFFDGLIREYHKAGPTDKHVTDWDASAVGENGVLDVAKLGLPTLSMRVRVGRNLKRFNLPGNMSRQERIDFEKAMLVAFGELIKNPAFGGQVYSLTPDFGTNERNPNLISEAEYKELVANHIMFKDMDEDPYLKSAGISSDWPYGRGCYVSNDGQVIIWMGEEDQLRIMCMKKGTKLNEVFDRLRNVLDTFEQIPGIEFAHDPDFGYITSCPSNLGTGMRASVHVKIPELCKDGTDTKAKAICKEFGLSVRGLGGEHTPIGADGTVDISPSARLFIKERDIIVKLYEGIRSLVAKEREAAGLPPFVYSERGNMVSVDESEVASPQHRSDQGPLMRRSSLRRASLGMQDGGLATIKD